MDKVSGSITHSGGDNTLAGGGEMGWLMRERDWDSSPLGSVEQWPQSLRTAVSICLASRFPIILFWGKELRQFYNDAYRPILGINKHPQALGQRAKECWPEIWDVIGPMLHGVLSGGEATWSENQLLLLDRNGYVEETYFTFSYSAIRNEAGEVGGVFCAVTETTGEVLGERRLRTLRELAAETTEAHGPEEACRVAARILAGNPADIPFALLYLLDAQGKQASLSGTAGVPDEAPANPARILLSDQFALWPLMRVVETGQSLLVDELKSRYSTISGPLLLEERLTPHSALILPIAMTDQEQPYGFLIAGVSPRRTLDDDYRGFLTLVAGQVAKAIAAARAYHDARERAEALAELDRAKTTFFSNISHEFRTPLTLLLGPLETLLSDAEHPLTAEQRAQLELARRNALRQQKLVNALLDFSRIEAGRVDAAYMPTDLATLTADLASAFRSAIEKAGMQLIVNCPPLPEPVYVDREMWEKIVLNLLSNAFKFTFEGSITVELCSVHDEVELSVSDTGIGIAEKNLAHLFERFHRVRSARARTYEGSGIGLALVQELVRLHQGTIIVTSQPGLGTTFTVRLPRGTWHLPTERIKADHSLIATSPGVGTYIEEVLHWLPEPDRLSTDTVMPFTEVPEHAAASPLVPQARLLVVDDNADMRDYLKRLLGPSYILQLVADGTTALELARSWRPDLILSDVMMPGLDGFALLEALRADPQTRAIPVIILSARAGEEATIEGLRAGADDYLIKPFSAREVLARVAARLEIAHLRQDLAERAQQLEAVFEAITDGVFMLQGSDEALRINRAGRELLGLPDETLQGLEHMPFDLLDEQGTPLPYEAWPEARLRRGESLQGANAADVLMRTRDGRVCYLSMTGAPLYNTDGSIHGGVLVSRDVTERRRLEQHTRDALRALLAMAQVVVQRTEDESADPEQSLTVMRRVAHQIASLACTVLGCERIAICLLDTRTGLQIPLTAAGLSPEQERQWWAEIPTSRLQDYVDASTRSRLQAGEALVLDFLNERSVERSYYGFGKTLATPLLIAGNLVGMLAVDYGVQEHTYTQDEIELVRAIAHLTTLVIERERLLHERAEAQARELGLREANRLMDEFIGIASHEIKTPLTVIKANVQLALRRLEALSRDWVEQDARIARQIEHLLMRSQQQVERQTRLLNDLLDVSRVQVGKLEMRMAPCNLLTIVQEAVEDQRQVTPERTITLALPSEESIPIVADAERIGQVVSNYLTNALKYSKADQPVAVSLSVEGVMARVSVQDQGPGLSPAQQERIWERFYRVESIEVQSGSGVGLGLGLHICRMIVEHHRGRVAVASTPGVGSTFWFTLPLAPIQK